MTWQVRLDPSSGDTGYNGLSNVDVDVTTTDDEDLPTAALSLDPSSISENGGVSTVTATLSGPSSEATTLTVAAVALSPTAPGDFTLSSTNTLTIAAGATTSTGTVTVTAVDNAVVSPDKTVVVSATAAGGNGVANPSGATLTLRDDDYGLDVGAVSGTATEAGGKATFTVALLTRPTAAVTVAVSSLDTGEGTVAPSSLTFAAVGLEHGADGDGDRGAGHGRRRGRDLERAPGPVERRHELQRPRRTWTCR